MRVPALIVAVLACAGAAPSQTTPPPPGIQDNSFLIEEAYNQEEGVVQHISLFRKDPRTGEWSASFTQEWPAGGLRHQLSYTVTYQRIAGDRDAFTGFGDSALNYRYQLIGDGEARVAVAPRLTVLLATGSSAKGLGAGATGLQIGVPISVLMGSRFVANGNLGFTWTPSARDAAGERAGTTAGYAGGSVIWLARPNLNGMLEALWSSGEVVTGPGATRADSSFYLSPGLRWSYDFATGLQIVPGIGVPIGVGPSHGKYAVLVYLSFEHPFASTTAR